MRNEPAYSITEAGRYLRLSPATLRSWFLGRPYPTAQGLSQFAPVLKLPKREPATLSFSNLIEAHVLRSLRTEHGVPLVAVRQALAYAQRELRIDQLLLREELRTAGGELFLDRYGELMNLSASGQLAMRKVFEAHLMTAPTGATRAAQTTSAAFSLCDARTFSGLLDWSARASSGTKRKREQPIQLAGRYSLGWREYSEVATKYYQRFRYLAVEVVGPVVAA